MSCAKTFLFVGLPFVNLIDESALANCDHVEPIYSQKLGENEVVVVLPELLSVEQQTRRIFEFVGSLDESCELVIVAVRNRPIFTNEYPSAKSPDANSHLLYALMNLLTVVDVSYDFHILPYTGNVLQDISQPSDDYLELVQRIREILETNHFPQVDPLSTRKMARYSKHLNEHPGLLMNDAISQLYI